MLIKYCFKHQISIDWLLTGEGQPRKGYPSSKEGLFVVRKPMALYEFDTQGFVFVPQDNGKISAGGGLIPETAIKLRFAFRNNWI